MAAGLIDRIVNPASRNRPVAGQWWCGDNAEFGGNYPGHDAFLAWCARWVDCAPWCRFITAPDVVGDAAGTLERAAPMLPRIRALGFPVALVAQNGLESLPVPWHTFDALFIGGDTAWKLGPAAARLAGEAKRRGKWVHMGRVNSRRRIQHAAAMGCDSVDGTYLRFGPNLNLPAVLSWVSMLPMEATP
jgi:hypothetical protein